MGSLLVGLARAGQEVIFAHDPGPGLRVMLHQGAGEIGGHRKIRPETACFSGR